MFLFVKSSWKKFCNQWYFATDRTAWIIWRKIIAIICATYAVAKRKPEKKNSGLFGIRNPWPLRYRCSALPIKLTRQLGAGRHIWSNRRNIKIRTPSHHQVRQIRFADWEDFDHLYVKIDSFHQHPRKQRCVKIVLNHGNQATKDLKYKTAFQVFFFHHFN